MYKDREELRADFKIDDGQPYYDDYQAYCKWLETRYIELKENAVKTPVKCCKNYEDFEHDIKVNIENILMGLFWSGAIGMDSFELLKKQAIESAQKTLTKYIT